MIQYYETNFPSHFPGLFQNHPVTSKEPMFQPTNYYESFGLKVKAPFEEITIFDQNIIKKTEWMTFLKNVPNSSNSFNFTVFWILLTFC